MSARDETPTRDETSRTPRELQREARRLARLRLVEVREVPKRDDDSIWPFEDFEPDPKEAA